MRLVIVATAVAALSLAACGKHDETPKPGVKVSGDRVTVTGKDGSTTIITDKSAIQAGMPDFAPLYPGAKTENAIANLGNAKADGGTLVYKAEATPEAVVAFYKEKAAASGFKTEMDANMGAARMFAAGDEASGKALQVIASAADGGTSVQVIWATKRK